MKLAISKKQLDKLRIFYAIALASGYRGLSANTLFEEGVNPKWMKTFDVLGRRGIEGLEDWQIRELKEQGKTEYGCFKIRKTKRRYVFYVEIASIEARPRLKNI